MIQENDPMNTSREVTKWLKSLALRKGYSGFKENGLSLEAYESTVNLLAQEGKHPAAN